MRILWNPSNRVYREIQPPPVLRDWFFIQDTSGGTNTVSFTKGDGNAPTLTIETSMDGLNWSVLGTTSTTPLTATIGRYEILYLRCETEKWGTDATALSFNHIDATADYLIGGNIMSLVYGANFIGNETDFNDLGDCHHVFYNLFVSSSTLQHALCDLPAENLVRSCYESMFYNCTGLQQAPSLDAENLAEKCYQDMFAHCDQLTTAPDLPATVLEPYCYSHMFHGCYGLTDTPELPAPMMKKGSCEGMFYDCLNVDKITCLATDVTAVDCTLNWTYNVAQNGTFYKDPSMFSWSTGTDGIPSNWAVNDY